MASSSASRSLIAWKPSDLSSMPSNARVSAKRVMAANFCRRVYCIHAQILENYPSIIYDLSI
jgi:hypothetical protein